MLRPAVAVRPRSRALALALVLVVGTMGALAGALVVAHGVRLTLSLFTNQHGINHGLGAAAIFRGERGTPAFTVSDRSSGSAIDRSSGLAFAGDGRWFTSRAWPVGADAGRYLEADMSGPLPAALGASSVALTVSAASDGAGVTTCYWVEIRRASSGALVSSHGSSGSPVDCVTGTTFESTDVTLSGVTGTDLANDLRVRIHATNGAAGYVRLDRLVVAGTTPYATFTLYPLLTRDVNGADVQAIPWELAGP